MSKLKTLGLGLLVSMTTSCEGLQEEFAAREKQSLYQQPTQQQLYQELNRKLQHNNAPIRVIPDQDGNPTYLHQQKKGWYTDGKEIVVDLQELFSSGPKEKSP